METTIMGYIGYIGIILGYIGIMETTVHRGRLRCRCDFVHRISMFFLIWFSIVGRKIPIPYVTSLSLEMH